MFGHGMNFELILTIIFAVIALVIILKLRSVLGRRTGHEAPPPEWGGAHQRRQSDNVIDMPGREVPPEDVGAVDPDASPVERGLAEIKQADPSFNSLEFLDGAKSAFRMVVEAFSEGDRETLDMLLADEVFENFDAAIKERESAGETQETELVDLLSARITDAALVGGEARVTLTFVSKQKNAVRDKDGKVIDGDPDEAETLTDIWTFARDTRSKDPNWELVETDVAE